MALWISAAAALSLGLATLCVLKLVHDLLWRPCLLLDKFRRQGIRGPTPSLIVGNLRQIQAMATDVNLRCTFPNDDHSGVVENVLPFYSTWSKAYGETFLVWWGLQPRLIVSDPEIMKEILCNKSGNFDRAPDLQAAKDLLGNGTAMLRMTERWAQKRKMVSMAFQNDKLKMMIGTMASCVEENLQRWTCRGTMDVMSELKDITRDVLCRLAFGTSYAAGKEVFEMQVEQQFIFLEWQGQVHIPGFRFLPTPKNRRRWTLRRRIDAKLRKIVMDRSKESKANGFGTDLLGLILAAKNGALMGKLDIQVTMQDVIDECKTFFFTGQETSAALLAWTMMLLALNPEWQDRLRQETLEVCKGSPPSSMEALNNLKLMTLVLNEVLRLYPPVPVLLRYVHKQETLRGLKIPRGAMVEMALIAANYNEKLWGSDARTFDPTRFAATNNNKAALFLPFSVGPRTCIGQNFANIEVRVILSIILQRFSFELSNSYIHSPFQLLTLQPKFGMPMNIKPVYM